jgi:hypothetical protein
MLVMEVAMVVAAVVAVVETFELHLWWICQVFL